MSGKKRDLDDLVREAKDGFVPESIDWAKIEAGLLPRVEREAKARAAENAYRGKVPAAWVAAGVALAAAAAIPLFMNARTTSTALDAPAAEAPERAAGAVAWKDANAKLTVTRGAQSIEASANESVARGEAIEVHGGRAGLARPAPGAVEWALEDGARVVIAEARGALILTLEKGAVEAQVAPVAGGEAFAVDVGGARVAVHGTHLRVAQEGTRAVVDLREGVVSIGLPPKSGSTYGDLVTAPAHVEFDPADPHGSLKVTHDAGRVRAAAALDRPTGEPPLALRTSIPPNAAVAAPSPRQLAAPPSLGASHSPLAAPPAALVAPKPASPSEAPVAPSPVASPEPPPATPARVDPHPEQSIVDAIRACARQHQATLPSGVALTISSRLEIQVGDRGMVERAQFDPPLAPEVQACAAKVIWSTRFSAPGAVNVPIDVSAP